jgi:hypothetical protein
LDGGSEGGTMDGGTDGRVTDSAADGEAGALPDPRCDAIDRDATFSAHVRITTDNECEVFVNGVSVGFTNNWGSAVTIDLSLFLHPSRENVIAVRGTNTSSQGGLDRGIIGEVTVATDGGSVPVVVTDASWRVATVEEPGWTELDFDGSGWAGATVIANHGEGPWGFPFGVTTAQWIWSAPVPSSTSDKPNLETTWARRSFYLSLDGTEVASTPACP